MKNIFLIPTQEESSLFKTENGLLLYNHSIEKVNCENQFIYITDDSKIEVNNTHIIWVGKDNIPYLKKVLARRGYTKNAFEFLCSGSFDAWYDADKLKKVILTNNPNLKNVQQLTVEQLQEYCSNPVDSVEVVREDYETDEMIGDSQFKRRFTKSVFSLVFSPKKELKTERLYTEKDMFSLTLEALDLGMRIRQDQLNGHSDKSGTELHTEWFHKLFKTK